MASSERRGEIKPSRRPNFKPNQNHPKTKSRGMGGNQIFKAFANTSLRLDVLQGAHAFDHLFGAAIFWGAA